MKNNILALLALFTMYGCASVESKIPDDAISLTTEEITTTFSGVSESYVGKDNPAVTATATFGKAGEYEASWVAGNQNGKSSGEWYADNGKRCLKENKPDKGGVSVECHTFYKTGNLYTSVNDDGSVHGVHTLSPLK